MSEVSPAAEGASGDAKKYLRTKCVKAETQELKAVRNLLNKRIEECTAAVTSLKEARQETKDYASYRDLNVNRHVVDVLRSLSSEIGARITKLNDELGKDAKEGKDVKEAAAS